MQNLHCGYARAPVQTVRIVPICRWQTNTGLNEGTMNLIRNYRNWRRYRDTVNELSRLSNRELNDLGINRADITAVANKTL
jgi:uncharacterized protein YjiS (DUF1127 family)